jgi:hypothetical protein
MVSLDVGRHLSSRENRCAFLNPVEISDEARSVTLQSTPFLNALRVRGLPVSR